MTEPKLAMALIAECKRLIGNEMADRLEGKDRFTAKMIARALEIAERDLNHSQDAEAAEWAAADTLLGEGKSLQALAAALRDGRFDGDEAAHRALLEMVERRVAISNPAALKG